MGQWGNLFLGSQVPSGIQASGMARSWLPTRSWAANAESSLKKDVRARHQPLPWVSSFASSLAVHMRPPRRLQWVMASGQVTLPEQPTPGPLLAAQTRGLGVGGGALRRELIEE